MVHGKQKKKTHMSWNQINDSNLICIFLQENYRIINLAHNGKQKM
jgi:hypothetical protein